MVLRATKNIPWLLHPLRLYELRLRSAYGTLSPTSTQHVAELPTLYRTPKIATNGMSSTAGNGGAYAWRGGSGNVWRVYAVF